VLTLITILEQAGVSPDQLELMDRNASLEAWAEIVLVDGAKVTVSVTKTNHCNQQSIRRRKATFAI